MTHTMMTEDITIQTVVNRYLPEQLDSVGLGEGLARETGPRDCTRLLIYTSVGVNRYPTSPAHTGNGRQ